MPVTEPPWLSWKVPLTFIVPPVLVTVPPVCHVPVDAVMFAVPVLVNAADMMVPLQVMVPALLDALVSVSVTPASTINVPPDATVRLARVWLEDI